ncbi:MAG TPA: GNAT family N-acetyltransferase [Streptosporangiaceae bacterium]|nr:GNAT family N-acetyltransferase [Streptosporangiaceae bacterium]
MRIAVQEHRLLESLDLRRWDALQPAGGFYSSSPWLLHAERTADPPPFYFTADDGRHCAAMPAYPLVASSPFTFCRADYVIDQISRRATGGPADWSARLMPCLACGPRNPSHTGVALPEGLDTGTRRAVLDAVIHKAESAAHEHGLRSVAYLYVDATDHALRSALEAAGYAAMHGETTYTLAVPRSGDFADYVASLRNNRRRVRRDVRTLDAAGVSYGVHRLSDELAERVAPLEAQLYARYGAAGDEATLRGVLRSIARNIPGHAEVVTAEVGGRLAGFVLIFTHRRDLYARQAGFDYAVQGRLPLYFGLVYYELVRLAQRRGLSTIHYSIGADEAKVSRGCVGVGQIAYVKGLVPEIHRRLLDLARLSPPRT